MLCDSIKAVAPPSAICVLDRVNLVPGCIPVKQHATVTGVQNQFFQCPVGQVVLHYLNVDYEMDFLLADELPYAVLLG